MLLNNVSKPIEILVLPVVFLPSALLPIAKFHDSNVFSAKAPSPIRKFDAKFPPPKPILIEFTTISDENVFAPAIVCAPVVITPLAVALASGTFNVITGVVVPFATLDDKSVPLVPKVKAATLVTLPVP